MERRNRSLEALKRLQYIDTLDIQQRAHLLVGWVDQYIDDVSINNIDLTINDMKHLSELFYKNINFLKQHQKDIKFQLDSHHKIKKFLH